MFSRTTVQFPELYLAKLFISITKKGELSKFIIQTLAELTFFGNDKFVFHKHLLMRILQKSLSAEFQGVRKYP